MKTQTSTDDQKVIRNELFKIAKERDISTNSHWTTKFLANFVTTELLTRRQTKNTRAWHSRRNVHGDTGMRQVRNERRWEAQRPGLLRQTA